MVMTLPMLLVRNNGSPWDSIALKITITTTVAEKIVSYVDNYSQVEQCDENSNDAPNDSEIVNSSNASS